MYHRYLVKCVAPPHLHDQHLKIMAYIHTWKMYVDRYLFTPTQQSFCKFNKLLMNFLGRHFITQQCQLF